MVHHKRGGGLETRGPQTKQRAMDADELKTPCCRDPFGKHRATTEFGSRLQRRFVRRTHEHADIGNTQSYVYQVKCRNSVGLHEARVGTEISSGGAKKIFA